MVGPVGLPVRDRARDADADDQRRAEGAEKHPPHADNLPFRLQRSYQRHEALA
jgi:hypothetical protein